MTTSDDNQSQPRGGEHGGAGAASAPQAEAGGAERGRPDQQRHGRGRRRGGGRTDQQQQQQRPSQPRQQRTESGLDIDELRELTELFTAHGLTDFEFENADIRIRLSRNPAPTPGAQAVAPQAAPPQAPLGAMQTQAAAQSAPVGAAQAAAPAAEAPEEELHIVTSPIVGTFYRAPSPNDEPFAKVGSQVEQDTVVCIIEAMKLMNEIQAETTGTVVKIYVENGQPVEYGQPLFGVRR